MTKLRFTDNASPDIGFLIKEALVKPNNKQVFGTKYFIPIAKHLDAKIANRVEVIGTFHPASGKVKKADLKISAHETLEYCDTIGITTLLVADSEYFKYLAGVTAVEKHIGSTFQCAVKDYEHITVLPLQSYQAVEMFPEKQPLMDKCLETAGKYLSGASTGNKEFEFESYELVDNIGRLKTLLDEYKEYDVLACDIETTGLYLGKTEVLTIAFAYDEFNSFTVPVHEMYENGDDFKEVVRQFLIDYEGHLIFHNGLYDVKHLVYTWFMQSFDDIDGQIEGLNALKFHDTFILAYIALNSTARPSLGLKDLTYEFLGDYVEDMSGGAQNTPLDRLGIYNAKDVCGTFHVYNKYKHMIPSEIYQTIMYPSYRPLLKMMLNGMPIDLAEVSRLKVVLQSELEDAEHKLKTSEYVRRALLHLQIEMADKYNTTHKVKQKTYEDFNDIEFNPGSSKQLRVLLFDVMHFEPIDFTKTKLPKTDRSSIEEFLTIAEVDQRDTLQALVSISQAGIVLNTFVKAFETLSLPHEIEGYAPNSQGFEGYSTLHGSLVLGGTQSGRLNKHLRFY